MSKSQKTTSSSRNDPWKPAQAGLKDILADASTLSGETERFQPVRGDTTQQALDRMRAIAGQGSAAQAPIEGVVGDSTKYFGLGMGTLASAARGDYLGGNPHLRGLLDTIANDTANDVNGQFSAAGRYGSGAHSGTLGREIGNTRARAMLDDYNIERRNQLSAANQLMGAGFQGAQMAPLLDTANAYGAQMLGRVGEADDAYQMGLLQAPLKAAEWQSGLTVPIAGLGGSSSSYSKTKSRDPMGQIAGGAMMGLGLLGGPAGMGLAGGLSGSGGLFSAFGSNPFGMNVGLNPWSSSVSRA